MNTAALGGLAGLLISGLLAVAGLIVSIGFVITWFQMASNVKRQRELLEWIAQFLQAKATAFDPEPPTR